MSSVYFDPAVGGDGSTVTDDANETTGLGNGGHRTRFVPALSQTVAVAGFVKDQANAAADSAALAESSAISASSNADVATTQADAAATSAETAATKAGDASTSAASAALSAENAALLVLAGVSLQRSARTSNTILGTADKSSLIDITSGTFNQTFSAAATLGSGWYCYLRNAGTGEITLDPNTSELIDGLTTFVMYPGEMRLIQCDGTGFISVVITPMSILKVLTTRMIVVPPGYSGFSGFAWAGGGSGGSDTVGAGNGGGGGACVPFDKIGLGAAGSSLTITIGAGGLAVSGTALVGNTGGKTMIGSYVTSYGGGPGSYPSNANPSGGGGGGALSEGFQNTGGRPRIAPGTGVLVDLTGMGGGNGSKTASPQTYASWSEFGGAGGGCSGSSNYLIGGSSVYGGGGGSCGGTGTAGGTSLYGGKGGNGDNASAGQAGSQPSGGGGGGAIGYASGPGGAGQVNIQGVL